MPSDPSRPDDADRTASWGGLARAGARRSTEDGRREEADAARDRARRDDTGDEPDPAARAARDARREERRRRREALQAEARAAIERSESRSAADTETTTARVRGPLRAARPPEPETALRDALGPKQGAKAWTTLVAAADALDLERYQEVRRSLEPLVARAPSVAEVHELLGVACYRLHRWDDAIEHLEAYRDLSGSTERHPVLADCYRAIGAEADVDALWDELRESSPSGEIVTEGRIVTAATRADQGDFDAAVRILEKGWTRPKRPKEHHLRRAYALADLYERAGATTKARDLFAWLARTAPDFGDVGERAANV